MTRTDRIEWASARVERVVMTVAETVAGGKPVPIMDVEMHYSWKSGQYSKKILSVLN